MSLRFSFLAVLVAVVTVSCQHERLPSAPLARGDAERLMSSIRPGMTVAQIERAVPHTAISALPIHEHGGVWYNMSISDDFVIQFRASHPRDGAAPAQSTINYSPRLRDRKSLAFISGEERPW
jgi:hypothetical protein